MRIDNLILQNFKKFQNASFSFKREDPNSPNFHVFIGNNGAGKTSVLDAIAIGLGVWLEKVPDSLLANSHRRLTVDQKTVIATQTGDRIQPQQKIGDTSVHLHGRILDKDLEWGPSLETGKKGNRSRQKLGDATVDRILRSEFCRTFQPAIRTSGRSWQNNRWQNNFALTLFCHPLFCHREIRSFL